MGLEPLGIEARAVDGGLDVTLEERSTADRQDDGEDLAELAAELVLLRDEPPLLLLLEYHQQVRLRGRVPGDRVVRADVLGHARRPEQLVVFDPGEVLGELPDITLEFPVVEVNWRVDRFSRHTSRASVCVWGLCIEGSSVPSGPSISARSLRLRCSTWVRSLSMKFGFLVIVAVEMKRISWICAALSQGISQTLVWRFEEIVINTRHIQDQAPSG